MTRPYVQLVLAGMDIARLNLSHGTLDSHRQTIENLKEGKLLICST